MSLYRTYRPQNFDDVVGQEHIVTTLRQAVEQGQLAHAYLLAGTRGTGKTSTARILAKVLLTQGIDDPILKDQIIKGVEEGTLTDLAEIDAASNRGIDDMRSLLEKIQFTPVVSAAKVYIIDEVHMLTREAFNALLKTLEEPPPYAYFILATTELHKIPATIQSRCQRFLFKRIDEKQIAERLRFIAEKEHIKAEDAALLAIAHHAQGGLRDAISLLDQLRSLPEIKTEDVRERVGETGHQHVEQMMSAIDASDRDTIVRIIRQLEETGAPLDTFLRLMLDAVRDRLHNAVTERKSVAQIEPLLNALLQAVRDVRSSPLPGLTVEAALLSLCSPQGAEQKTIEHKLVEPPPSPLVSSVLGTSVPPTSSVPPTVPNVLPAPTVPNIPTIPNTPEASGQKLEAIVPSSASSASSESSTSSVSLDLIRSHWTAIMEKVEPASARMSLKNGRIFKLEGSTLTLAFSSSFHRDKASAKEGMHSLESSLEASIGTRIIVKCELDTELQGPPPVAVYEVDTAAAALDVF